MNARRVHNLIVFGEGSERWSFPDPSHERNGEARHTARYDLPRLTQTQAFDLASMGDTLAYLIHDCPTTKMAQEKIAAVRRAVRELPETEDPTK